MRKGEGVSWGRKQECEKVGEREKEVEKVGEL